MKRWSKIWPENAEGRRNALLRVPIILAVFFFLLLFVPKHLSDVAWDSGDFPLSKFWDKVSGNIASCLVIPFIMLFVVSHSFMVLRDWRRAALGFMCISWLIIILIYWSLSTSVREKPVLYLYPQTEQAVTVQLQYEGVLAHTYPEYPDDGWQVIAKPSGELTNLQTGRKHYCLFWEGNDTFEYGLDEGFLVAGKDTAAFLESTLSILGLSDREANEFIIYWLPRMEQNPFNLISFPIDEYSRHARLNITPKPDALIRVFMVFKAVDKPLPIKPQRLVPVTRHGFTAVEWGGTEIP